MGKQMEFDFMDDCGKYNIGESVVNRQNLMTGRIVSVRGSSVEVRYVDGSKEWISEDDATKLLLEIDPKPNKRNLNENWGT